MVLFTLTAAAFFLVVKIRIFKCDFLLQLQDMNWKCGVVRPSGDCFL